MEVCLKDFEQTTTVVKMFNLIDTNLNPIGRTKRAVIVQRKYGPVRTTFSYKVYNINTVISMLKHKINTVSKEHAKNIPIWEEYIHILENKKDQ